MVTSSHTHARTCHPPGSHPSWGAKNPCGIWETGAAPLGQGTARLHPPPPARWPTSPQHPAELVFSAQRRKARVAPRGPQEGLPGQPPAQSWGTLPEEPGKDCSHGPKPTPHRCPAALQIPALGSSSQDKNGHSNGHSPVRPRSTPTTAGQVQPQAPTPRELTAGGQERASGLCWGPGAKNDGEGAP